MNTFTLNTGASIPSLGLGTWQASPGEVQDAVLHALKVGYRHIDAAFVYGNEQEIGNALKEAFAAGIVKREDIFVTSKLWNSYHRRAEACLTESLKRLGLVYVDMYLSESIVPESSLLLLLSGPKVHWPVPMPADGNHDLFPTRPDGSRDIDGEWTHIQTWQALESLLESGKVKAIGVCNYSLSKLQELLPRVKVVPAVNQIENHPYLPQIALVEFCQAHGILVEAYSPLGSTGGPLLSNPQVKALAQEYGVGAATILINYQSELLDGRITNMLCAKKLFIVNRGNIALPKSVTHARLTDNLKVIKMESSAIATLDKIHESTGLTRYVYPAFGVDLGFSDKM